jgi:hypothetical protein
VFEACCTALERLLRPLDDGYLDLNSEREREPASNYLYKNQMNSAAGDYVLHFFFFALGVILSR